jgi:poly(3-hydroxybutyrate) depolymerase
MIQTTRIIAVSALLLWSMTVAAQEPVHFPSFEDNGAGLASTVLNGYLWRPAGGGQHPAVIFLHGCGACS